MHYHSEILDRSTGHLTTVSIGDWITVTELAERHGVGPRQVRAILHHMGLLQAEKGRYRLPLWAVEKGLGRRIDRPKSGHPFDVLSPLGQELVDQCWHATVADYEADIRKKDGIDEARSRLEAFRARRLQPMPTQEEVCWLLDQMRDITYQSVATILEVDHALVSRYAKSRANDRDYWRRWKKYSPRSPNDQDEELEPKDEYLRPDDDAC
jgi:hypothetical protein